MPPLLAFILSNYGEHPCTMVRLLILISSILLISIFSPSSLSSNIPRTLVERLGAELNGLCSELWANALPKPQLFCRFFSHLHIWRAFLSVSPDRCVCAADREQEVTCPFPPFVPQRNPSA